MASGTIGAVAVVASLLVSSPLRRPPETATELPFELYQHQVATKGSIGALNARNLLIDTGTIPSVVDGRIARKLRLKTEPSTLIGFGQQVPIDSAVFEGFRIGSRQSGPLARGRRGSSGGSGARPDRRAHVRSVSVLSFPHIENPKEHM